MLVGKIVELDPMMTKHFARGVEMTLCLRRNSIPNTTSKSSIFTTTKSVYPLHDPSFIVVRLAILMMGKATESVAFIFPASLSQHRLSRQTFVSIIKLWVAPKSTIVLLAIFLFTHAYTYMSPLSTVSLLPSAFFWSVDRNLRPSCVGSPRLLLLVCPS